MNNAELSMALRNVICVTVLLTHVIMLVAAAKKARNIHIKLHPIDSPKLPFFPKNLTLQQRHQIHVEISKARAFRLSSSLAKSPESISNVTITNSTKFITSNPPMFLSYFGAYAAEISIGTPPQTMYLLVDSGSDLTWVQCDGCDPCFPINEKVVHNFEFQFSKTYTNLPSNNPLCLGSHDVCEFRESYADGQVIEGVLANDTFIFGPELEDDDQNPGIVFGCGLRSNEKVFFDAPEFNMITGVFALGPGPKSILKQPIGLPSQAFAYCIPSNTNIKPLQDHIFLYFGYDAYVVGDVKSTPFLPNLPFYYVTLNGISVNGQNLEIDPRLFQLNQIDGTGGLLVDSGSTKSFLIRPAFAALETAVTQHFANQYGWVPVDNPYDMLCYRVEKADYDLPTITLHLDGADFVGDNSGIFEFFDDLYCMNFVPSETMSMWGISLMVNHKFVFDLETGFLLFVEETCSVNE